MERTLVESLEDRLRKVGQEPNQPDHREVHEEADGGTRDHGMLEPGTRRGTVEPGGNVGQMVADRTEHGQGSRLWVGQGEAAMRSSSGSDWGELLQGWPRGGLSSGETASGTA